MKEYYWISRAFMLGKFWPYRLDSTCMNFFVNWQTTITDKSGSDDANLLNLTLDQVAKVQRKAKMKVWI